MIIFIKTKTIFREKGFKKARIFFLRSFLYYPKVINWLKFIDLFYKKFSSSEVPSELLTLPIRSYINNKLNINNRIMVLKDHYKIMEDIFSPQAI